MNSLQGNRSPLGARAKKHRPPPQGEMSHISRRAAGATIASRMLAKLPTTSLRPVLPVQARACDPAPRRKYLAAAASSGFTLRERGSVQRRMFIRQVGTSCAWRKSTSLRQVPQVLAGDRADHAPGRVAAQPLHGLDHLAVDALALPGLPRAVGHRGRGGVQRNADAHVVAAQELDGRVVQQRGVGLDAEAEIVGDTARCRRRPPRGSAAARPRGR